MGKIMKKLGALGVALAVLGCDDLTDLEVINENNPDTERALASAADVEALISGAFLTWWDGTQHSNPYGSMSTMADRASSSWGNFGMRDTSSEPRVAWNNSSSYGNRGVAQTPWDNSYGALSAAADGLVAIADGLEIGGAGGPDNARAQAFSKFVQGVALGWLARQFDQAIIFDETVDLAAAAGGAFEFRPYAEVGAAALTKLDEAIAIANANSFTLPQDWINGVSLSNTEFAELMHSWKARIMVGLARTPTERGAVDWNAVLNEVNAGITEDFILTGTADNWWSRQTAHGTNELWMRGDYKTIGWTDTGGGYINWLNTAVADRDQFEMTTPDLRIWGCGESGDDDPGNQCRSVDGTTSRDARIGGNDGEANDQEPGLYFRFYGPAPHPAARGTYHWSMYHHWRYEDTFENGGVGPMPHMLVAEMDMIAAEAHLELGNAAAAVPLINKYRGPAGLPDVTTTNPQCPPVLTTCTLMDQMMYEKNMEVFNTATGLGYFDRRGWGPIASSVGAHHQGPVEGTPSHFPVPGAELEVLQLPTYTFGGVGAELSSGMEMPDRMTVDYEDIYAFPLGLTTREKLDYVEKHFRSPAGMRSLVRYQ